MDHPHKKSVSPRSKRPQTKTVFMPSIPGTLAILVESTGEKQKQKPITFPNPVQALTWCMANAAGFVYFQGDQVELN